MDLIEILDKIKERWISGNNFEAIIGLEKAPQGAATGTEGLSLIFKYIKDLKINNYKSYVLIEDLAAELESYVDRLAKNIK